MGSLPFANFVSLILKNELISILVGIPLLLERDGHYFGQAKVD